MLKLISILSSLFLLLAMTSCNHSAATGSEDEAIEIDKETIYKGAKVIASTAPAAASTMMPTTTSRILLDFDSRPFALSGFCLVMCCPLPIR